MYHLIMSGLCIKKTMEVSIETLVEATVTEQDVLENESSLFDCMPTI